MRTEDIREVARKVFGLLHCHGLHRPLEYDIFMFFDCCQMFCRSISCTMYRSCSALVINDFNPQFLRTQLLHGSQSSYDAVVLHCSKATHNNDKFAPVQPTIDSETPLIPLAGLMFWLLAGESGVDDEKAVVDKHLWYTIPRGTVSPVKNQSISKIPATHQLHYTRQNERK